MAATCSVASTTGDASLLAAQATLLPRNSSLRTVEQQTTPDAARTCAGVRRLTAVRCRRHRHAADARGGRTGAGAAAPPSDACVLRVCLCWHLHAHPLRLAPSPRYPSGALAPAACARGSRGGRLRRRLALCRSGTLCALSPLLSVRRNRRQRLLPPQLRLVLGQPLLALVPLRTAGASAPAASPCAIRACVCTLARAPPPSPPPPPAPSAAAAPRGAESWRSQSARSGRGCVRSGRPKSEKLCSATPPTHSSLNSASASTRWRAKSMVASRQPAARR